MGPLLWKVMGHILKSWDNDPGKACLGQSNGAILFTLWFHHVKENNVDPDQLASTFSKEDIELFFSMMLRRGVI